MSWRRAADILFSMKGERNLLGLYAAESNLVWRYYGKHVSNQEAIADKIDRRRILEERALELMME